MGILFFYSHVGLKKMKTQLAALHEPNKYLNEEDKRFGQKLKQLHEEGGLVEFR